MKGLNTSLFRLPSGLFACNQTDHEGDPDRYSGCLDPEGLEATYQTQSKSLRDKVGEGNLKTYMDE